MQDLLKFPDPVVPVHPVGQAFSGPESQNPVTRPLREASERILTGVLTGRGWTPQAVVNGPGLDKRVFLGHSPAMAANPESPLDLLWKEYALAFRDFDDLTLARWLAQTLGQLEGKAWRLSHPLLGAYRLAAQLGHERQIWFKRLANPPPAYTESPCCRAPMLPLLTRDVCDAGLICQHCSDTLVAFDDIPAPLQGDLQSWASQYGPVHAVAHWDDRQRKAGGHYERAYENAAKEAETLLAQAGSRLAPKLLEYYPAIVWEDQDECLEVRPEDVSL